MIEVNEAKRGSRDRVRTIRVAALLLPVVLSFIALSCGGDERKAQRLYREAAASIDRGDVAAGVERLETILERYPATDAAGVARKEIELYRGLDRAVRSYPMRRARDVVVQSARAIERYRDRHRRYPPSLAELVPELLPHEPVDPWDGPLDYRSRSGGRGYTLICRGADGAPGGEGDDADLVVVDGKFVRESVP